MCSLASKTLQATQGMISLTKICLMRNRKYPNRGKKASAAVELKTEPVMAMAQSKPTEPLKK